MFTEKIGIVNSPLKEIPAENWSFNEGYENPTSSPD